MRCKPGVFTFYRAESAFDENNRKSIQRRNNSGRADISLAISDGLCKTEET